MKLSTEYEDIPFIIEITKDNGYIEPPTQQVEREERELLLSQEVAYYIVIIEVDADNYQSTHYLQALLFSSNQEELLKELNGYLFDGDILDDILEIRKTAQNDSLLPSYIKE